MEQFDMAHATRRAAGCGVTSCSEQVHIAFGGPGEMTVNFANSDPHVSSSVEWGSARDRLTQTATGFKQSYTATLYFQEQRLAVVPEDGIGYPEVTATKVDQLERQNTDDWAKNRTGTPFSDIWVNRTEIRKGLGAYNNPGSYYNSPVLHTVTMSGLEDGATYYYRVASDKRVFSFTMPRSLGVFGTILGLTADLGQSPVSNASIDALKSMEPTAVLLSGDLSYADGWLPRWDSYGNLMEKLSTEVTTIYFRRNAGHIMSIVILKHCVARSL